jgi:metal-responsive CopG/Arc/MetJ family transcriptional regulator
MQITFTCPEKELNLIESIDELANTEKRSRSTMILLLLQLAVKEKTRKRNAKKVHL